MGIETTLRKVDGDLESGDYRRARDRLQGLIRAYPNDLSLRRRLGDVYARLQNPQMAGRYWYLEKEQSPDMAAACHAFERAFGGDPLHLLMALKFRGDLDCIAGTYAGQRLAALRTASMQRHGYAIEYTGRKGPAVTVGKRRDQVLAVGCALALVAAAALMMIGFAVVVAWMLRLVSS